MIKNATTISQGNQKLISYSNICVEHGQPRLKQVLFGGCTQPAFFQQPLAHTLSTHIKEKNIIKTYESLFYCTGLVTITLGMMKNVSSLSLKSTFKLFQS